MLALVIASDYQTRNSESIRAQAFNVVVAWLRETLFNILTAGNPDALDGSIWLDLYAGTGAVGIEALSRGAAMSMETPLAGPPRERPPRRGGSLERGHLPATSPTCVCIATSSLTRSAVTS